MNYAIPVGLIDLIRQSRTILCTSHLNADGDAYGDTGAYSNANAYCNTSSDSHIGTGHSTHA